MWRVREEESKLEEAWKIPSVKPERVFMIVLIAQIDSRMTTCCHIMQPIQLVPSMLAAGPNRGTIICGSIRFFFEFVIFNDFFCFSTSHFYFNSIFIIRWKSLTFIIYRNDCLALCMTQKFQPKMSKNRFMWRSFTLRKNMDRLGGNLSKTLLHRQKKNV